MSWSSSTSVAPGFRRASGRSGADVRSPVRYREDAMAYEPAKYCRCYPARKAPRWISWSRQNPGRRYYACVDALHGGCGYVEWHDGELPKFVSDLIGDLRDEVWRLKGQGNVGQDHQQAAMVAPNEDATSLMLVSVQDDLRKKNAEIAVMKAKFDRLVFLCIVFVLGLVAGKMLM
ncbi:hypothetical protein D1007_08590 [Hordeum vulgare]|uniref:GRF-type domain-containing protein n=1 Tax=Hordeum vulgare subsp. vulgare TaxID=112509 RepID=A0A8I6WPU0_HORVV|nr:hypothetical protein D1007_08590 [Hordeum vulgare]KAI4964869.1 hypothetical protein ZWY2020_058091 [Hordeum vulgare]